jgi:hypothetical protein
MHVTIKLASCSWKADARGSERYRKQIAEVYVRRIIETLLRQEAS